MSERFFHMVKLLFYVGPVNAVDERAGFGLILQSLYSGLHCFSVTCHGRSGIHQLRKKDMA